MIADEPTRNLDVTIQAGILKLIDELSKTLGITVLYIANIWTRVGHMQANGVLQHGAVVEQGNVKDVLKNPQNPYTRILLDAITPEPEPKRGSQSGGSGLPA